MVNQPQVLRPSGTSSTTQPCPRQRLPNPGPADRPVVVLDSDEVLTLIKRGKDLLNDGVAASRPLFERTADAGSAEAAGTWFDL